MILVGVPGAPGYTLFEDGPGWALLYYGRTVDASFDRANLVRAAQKGIHS